MGGLGALCALPQKYCEPILVSSTYSGIRVKVLLAMNLKRYDIISIDLIAICINDLIVKS